MKMLTHHEVEALRTAPAEGDARAQAALRLLDAYERLRGEHHDAGDLECLLDEAIADQSLYHGDDEDECLLPETTYAELKGYTKGSGPFGFEANRAAYDAVVHRRFIDAFDERGRVIGVAWWVWHRVDGFEVTWTAQHQVTRDGKAFGPRNSPGPKLTSEAAAWAEAKARADAAMERYYRLLRKIVSDPVGT